MDLLKTILVYMSLVFATSVQNAPEPSYIPQPTATPYAVQATATPTATPKPTPVPTIDITPNPAYKTIQVGDNGDLVREMQEKLAEYGYYAGDIDGRFGNQTRRAVEAFQYQHGLSADGIAGRRTLTVLYESPEIRLAPSAEATPSPTPETQLAAAITPEPSAEPTFVPVETAVVTATPQVTASPEPTAEPAPTAEPTAEPTPAPAFLPMEGAVIRVTGVDESLTAVPYTSGEQLYLPLIDILRSASMNVITSTSIEQDEFAFAVGDDLIRIAYTENQNGDPVNLEAYRNIEPQIVPLRDVRRVGETIYLPAVTIESLTGIAAQPNEDGTQIVVTIPALTEE